MITPRSLPYYQTQFQYNQDGLMLSRTNPLRTRRFTPTIPAILTAFSRATF